MKLTGHKTEAVYRRYAIVSEADLAAGVTRLAVLHESLTKGTRTVVPMRPVRSGGGHPGHRGCGQLPAGAPRSGPRTRKAPPQHLERECLDLARESPQPACDGETCSLQLRANLLRAAGHGHFFNGDQSMMPFERR